jgi:hypothetical protein
MRLSGKQENCEYMEQAEAKNPQGAAPLFGANNVPP